METEVRTVITSPDCVPLLKRVLNLYPTKVQRIIYIDGFKKLDFSGFSEAIEVLPLSELEKIGRKLIQANQERPYFSATPDHLMCIMYTSGTTGTPKGALMTHRQFLGSMRALFILVQELIDTAPDHTYIAYLPMAHVLELTVQLFLFFGKFFVVFVAKVDKCLTCFSLPVQVASRSATLRRSRSPTRRPAWRAARSPTSSCCGRR